jgi:ubiquinol-cytochrome c reductase cytochrome c1 subunit
VYREVCASCHALEHIYFRNLVGITHTEDEVKKIAESYDIVDGPNAEGVSGRGGRWASARGS